MFCGYKDEAQINEEALVPCNYQEWIVFLYLLERLDFVGSCSFAGAAVAEGGQ